MRTKLLSGLLIAISALTAISAHADDDPEKQWRGCYRGARSPAKVMNLTDIVIAPSSGKALQLEQVKEAIIAAAAEKKWTVSTSPDGKLLASLLVRGKHTVIVEIPFTTKSYSLLYKDSTNMHYALCDGQGYIHPNYNQWVNDLKTAIQAKLRAL